MIMIIVTVIISKFKIQIGQILEGLLLEHILTSQGR